MRFLRLLAAVGWVATSVAWPVPGWTQDTPAASPVVEAAADAAADPAASDARPGDDRPGDDRPGNDRPGVDLPEDVPPWYLSRLDVDGAVVDDRAELAVDIQLYVTRPDVWQEVPIRLPQATVSSRDYEGVGEAAPILSPEGGVGLRWKFRGAGRHRLQLNVLVPLRKTPAGQRLVLTLPSLPTQFRGSVRLTIPETPLELAGDGIEVGLPTVRGGRTFVEAFVSGGGPQAGTRADLSWTRPQSVAYGTVDSVRTDATLRGVAAEARLELTADQELRGGEGGLSIVRVRVPTGFTFQSVTGPRFAERLPDASDEGDGPRWVTVRLDNSPDPLASLRWTFVAPLPEAGTDVKLEGLDVETARRESGRINVAELPDFRVAIDWESREGVRQVRASTPSVVASAEFFRQPFAMPVSIRPQPLYVVSVPTATLEFDGGAVRLRSEFELDVESGRLAMIPVQWPAGTRAEWETVRVATGVGLADAEWSEGGDALRFDPPLTGPATVAVVARRSSPAGQSFRVGLPTLAANSGRAAKVSVRADASVELDVRGSEGTEIEPVAAASQATAEADDGTRELQTFEVVSGPVDLRVTQIVREPRVSVAAVLRLTPDADGGLSIGAVYDLRYAVQFGRIDRVLLQLPREFVEDMPSGPVGQWLPFLVDGRPVPAENIQTIDAAIVRLRLPAPTAAVDVTLGPIRLPADDEGQTPARVTVPMVRAVDHTFESLRVVAERSDVFAVVPSGVSSDGLVQSPMMAVGRTEWIARDPSQLKSLGVSLQINPDISAAPLEILSTAIDVDIADGSLLVTGRFTVADYPEEFLIRLPTDAGDINFTWNDGEATAERLRKENGDFRVVPDVGVDAASSFGVRYELPRGATGLLSRVDVLFPTFPVGVNVDDAVVRIRTSSDRYLITAPQTLKPQFRWVRRGLAWARTASVASGDESPSDRNSYSYASESFPDSVAVVTAPGGVLLLIGAVPVIAVGYLLTRLRGRLRVAVVLLSILGVSFAAVFLGRAFDVFVQPALLGLLMVAVAAVTSRRRRSLRSPVLRVGGGPPPAGPRPSTQLNLSAVATDGGSHRSASHRNGSSRVVSQ